MEKKKYIAPEIEIVKLDNEISLSMESDPMEGPNEVMFKDESKKTDPFKQFG